ncbi:MAG: methylmalonyl Co-A mutase-associated GTPase MeaB [Gammaproteobacteria bacterium]|nr:methylmalonyl Co-A mutase-associated GTPase MeaB [Gammaproteobacteria bacterium]NIR83413.1 methylmalonyl Co-A mutase-associated GTPase MeaB [Gammaproteobacteria bacterium]NIR91335.1 methylmalonyl Co-A mutase-associated GTPase MeaB [Gammaproteobacteria bacterium]NIU04575.1 methylmalonyl Co-A mutase-associated GTPase MeaB [Gammaproteobacteria bacterium]NIV51617.1 methylmalonyl Co-A mutase-associated GTPase MeaB [Gammaproteobacteria bacterium]
MSEKLIADLLSGKPGALARAITAVTNGTALAPALLSAVQPRLGRAVVVGVTGAAGVGKSTLVNACIRSFRRRGRSVGVVAVDPSSPLTGGALLGDRVRMSEHAADPGVFVRSLASREHAGALPPAAARIVDLMDASGRDVVVIETVGAGQTDVEVADVADIKVVVCAPGQGDEVQAIKAGLLEIADVLVVNKNDLPLARRTLQHLKEMVAMREPGASAVPVLGVSARTGEGVDALVDTVEAIAARAAGPRQRTDARARVHRMLAATAASVVSRRIRAMHGPALARLCEAVQRGELDVDEAARRLLDQELGFHE